MGASADIVVGVDGSAGATAAPAIDVLERRSRAAELGVVGTGHLDHHGQHLLCHSVARDIAHRAVRGPSADIVARRWYRLRRVWWPIAATTSLAVLLAHGGDAAAGARVRVLLAAVAAAQIGASNAPRVRNAMKVALGVLTLLSGAGFLPFVVKEARSGTALAAIVAVVAGAGLIATGSGGIVRPQRRWARAAAIAVTGALLVCVGYVTAPAIMVTNAAPAELDRRPSDVGLTATDVALPTRDGITLAGWYVASRNRAAVVLLHGSGSTRSDVIRHAATLAGDGFGVLMIDARGHGASTGDAMERGWHGDDDIAAATEFLAARADVDPTRIGLVGISMGGEEAIGAAAGNDDVRAVVAEGVTGRTSADLTWLPARYGWRGALQHRIERWRDTVTAVLAGASAPISLATAIVRSGDVRFMLITAGDVADEAYAAASLRATAPGRVARWNVPGAAHAATLDQAPEAWRDHVTSFLRVTLLSDIAAP